MPDVVSISNAAADAAGAVRLLVLAAGCAESGLNPFARRPANPSQDEAYWPDVSFGVWQQTVRWAPEYRGGADFPGSAEIARVGALYTDPEHAATVAAANLKSRYRPNEPDAIFRALCRYNWPAGDGQPASAEVADNYRRGIADAQALLGDAPMPTYNPDQPIATQNHDWDCAEQSTLWALTALGRHPSDAWLEQAMLSGGIESTELGLLVGDGSALARFITEQYSDPSEGTPTISAYNNGNVSYDDVRSIAGKTAVMIGGHGWGDAGHWVGVRCYDPAQGLILANPGGDGPIYGQKVLDRQAFAQRGPWAMVVLQAAGSEPGPAPDPAPIVREQLAIIRAAADKIEAVIS